jgi:hypothetical protein
VNDDFEPGYRERASAGGFDPFVGRRRCPRFQVCKKHLPADSKPDVATVKSLLACREGPVCNDGTLACVVMLLGETPELHISKGGSDQAPFTVLRFDR